MGNFRKNKKTVNKARGTIDKSQNQLIMNNKKAIDELKESVETKYAYSTYSQPVDSYDGTSTASRLNGIYKVDVGDTQGLTDQDRIGDKVALKHIDLTYQLSLENPRPSEFLSPKISTRIMLFWDNQPNYISAAGVTQTNPVYWPQLMQIAPNGGGASTDVDKQLMMVSLQDWDNRKRYNFIYDKVHTLCPTYNGAAPLSLGGAPDPFQQTGLGARASSGIVKFTKSYKRQKILYTSGGSIPNNRQLYVAVLSDVLNAQASTPNLAPCRPLFSAAIRCLYDDA